MQSIIQSKVWRTLLIIALFVSSICFVGGSIAVFISFRNQNQNDKKDEAVRTCLVSFGLDLSEALRQRDQVGQKSRDANIEWIEQITLFVENPESYSQEALVDSLNNYRDSLIGLNTTVNLNSYPNLKNCFIKAGVLDEVVAGEQGKAAEILLEVSNKMHEVITSKKDQQ